MSKPRLQQWRGCMICVCKIRNEGAVTIYKWPSLFLKRRSRQKQHGSGWELTAALSLLRGDLFKNRVSELNGCNIVWERTKMPTFWGINSVSSVEAVGVREQSLKDFRENMKVWQLRRDSTGCVCGALRLRSGFDACWVLRQHSPAACRVRHSSAQQDSWSQVLAVKSRPVARDFVLFHFVINFSSSTLSSLAFQQV